MYIDINGPPAAYERVVAPVSIATRSAPMKEKDRRDTAEYRRKRRQRKKEERPEDAPYEPFLGKLFDFSA